MRDVRGDESRKTAPSRMVLFGQSMAFWQFGQKCGSLAKAWQFGQSTAAYSSAAAIIPSNSFLSLWCGSGCDSSYQNMLVFTS
mmetsp:Transcript_52943/g.139196  ORF Transcript_52943/g.139196 Transcript_52943/m.139196 type:complete len:83 (-) Transcript_52943:11-259(-)